MIEIKDSDKAYALYEMVKERLIALDKERGFEYNKNVHHLYEDVSPEVRKHFYNESGHVSINGFDIVINRFHPHKHNGYSGLNSMPTCYASIKEGDSVIWEINIKTGTLYYHAEATSLMPPLDLLHKKKKLCDISPYELGSIIATLMSVMEGEDFKYMETYVDEVVRKHGVMDSWDSIERVRYLGVFKNKPSDIKRSLERGECIIIGKDNSVIADTFPYVKRFCKDLSKIDDISRDKMLEFLKQFLLSEKERLIESYERNINEKILSISSSNVFSS